MKVKGIAMDGAGRVEGGKEREESDSDDGVIFTSSQHSFPNAIWPLKISPNTIFECVRNIASRTRRTINEGREMSTADTTSHR
jgi:hypothetical protein